MTREEAIRCLSVHSSTNGSGLCTDKQYYEAKQMAIKALEQEPRWIPISEKLPEEHKWLGTKRFGTTKSDEVYVTFENPKGERFTRHLSFENGELPPHEQTVIDTWFKGSVPIAWMPLPEPYKAESEVQE